MMLASGKVSVTATAPQQNVSLSTTSSQANPGLSNTDPIPGLCNFNPRNFIPGLDNTVDLIHGISNRGTMPDINKAGTMSDHNNNILTAKRL